MRKLIVSMNLSLDGFMSDADTKLDWHFQSWDEEMSDQLLEHLYQADSILLGRITYEAMASYWPVKSQQPDFPRTDLAIADRMNQLHKIVFSMGQLPGNWSNTTVMHGGLTEEIQLLKNKKGKDMLVFGSGKLVSCIIRAQLADEFRLWVHPVVLGKGKPLFENLKERIQMKLIDSFVFDSGVMLLSYAPVYK